MRKYHQAALAIISVVSLVALVLYRNEYIKLRHVLEVFDYFGKPPDRDYNGRNCTNNVNIADNNIVPSISQSFDEPSASWQRLNDEIYVYSAYAINDEEIRAVSFAKDKRLKSMSCKIVHENDIEQMIGVFSYIAIESTKSIDLRDEENSRKGIYRGYELICRHKRTEKKIVAAVLFASIGDKREYGNEISLAIKKLYPSWLNTENDKISLCVAPINSHYLINDDIIDFISFHNSIGIERFVVYDIGLPHRVNNILKHIDRQSGTNFNLTYTTIPWNFPFPRVSAEVARLVINADCLYRLYNTARFIATLAWDEYIVTKYHRTIDKFFRDIDQTGLIARQYGLSTINYCHDRKTTNINDDDDAKPRILGDETIANDRSIYIYRSGSDEITKTRVITRDVILVNKYERRCNYSSALKPVDDPYVAKFSPVVRTSPIYKLFRLYI